MHPSFFNAKESVCFISLYSASAAAFFATTSTSTFLLKCSLFPFKAFRSLRFILFRTTAFLEILFETITPTRDVASAFKAEYTVNNGVLNERPFLNTRFMSSSL